MCWTSVGWVSGLTALSQTGAPLLGSLPFYHYHLVHAPDDLLTTPARQHTSPPHSAAPHTPPTDHRIVLPHLSDGGIIHLVNDVAYKHLAEGISCGIRGEFWSNYKVDVPSPSLYTPVR